ncbi:MAG: hypothetical protein ACRDBY_08675 [Cetobacterium sp.]
MNSDKKLQSNIAMARVSANRFRKMFNDVVPKEHPLKEATTKLVREVLTNERIESLRNVYDEKRLTKICTTFSKGVMVAKNKEKVKELLNAIYFCLISLDNQGAKDSAKIVSDEIIIDTPDKIEKLKSKLNRHESLSIPSLTFDSESNVLQVESKAIGVSRGTKFAEILNPRIVYGLNGSNMSQQVADDFYAPPTNHLLSITTSCIEDVLEIVNGVKVIYGENGLRVIFTRDDNSMYEKTENGIVNIKEEDIKDKYRLYKIFLFGASGARNETFIMMDVTDGDRREEILDHISLGAYSRFKTKWGFKSIDEIVACDDLGMDDLKKKAKEAMRFGQLLTASVSLDRLDVIVYQISKWLDENGDAVHDGTGVVLNVFVAKGLEKMLYENYGLKVKISKLAVTGLFIQARPGMTKGAFLVVTEAFMRLCVKMRCKGLKVVNAKEANNGLNENDVMVAKYDNFGICNTSHEKLQEIVDGKCSINDIPSIFYDGNVEKLYRDFELPCDFHMLNISFRSESSMSAQEFDKLQEAVDCWKEHEMERRGAYDNNTTDERFAEIDKETSIEASKLLPIVIEQLGNNTLEKQENNAMSGDRLLTPYEFDHATFSNKLMAIDSEVWQNNPAVRSSIIKGLVKEAVSKAQKIKFTANSTYAAITSDITHIPFGVKVLHYGEFYSAYYNNLIKRKTDQENKCIQLLTESEESRYKFELIVEDGEEYWTLLTYMIKFPSSGNKELLFGRFVSIELLLTRIMKLTQFEEFDRKTVCDMWKRLSKGVVIVPADKDLMDKLAGLDFDFDAAKFTTEKVCVELVKHVKESITNIKK